MLTNKQKSCTLKKWKLKVARYIFQRIMLKGKMATGFYNQSLQHSRNITLNTPLSKKYFRNVRKDTKWVKVSNGVFVRQLTVTPVLFTSASVLFSLCCMHTLLASDVTSSVNHQHCGWQVPVPILCHKIPTPFVKHWKDNDPDQVSYLSKHSEEHKMCNDTYNEFSKCRVSLSVYFCFQTF